MFHNSIVNFHSRKKNKSDNHKIKNKLIISIREKDYEDKSHPVQSSFHELSKENDLIEKCLLGKKCPFNQNLKLVNQSLYISVSDKNRLFNEIKEENNKLKGIIYNITGMKYSEIINSNTSNIFINTNLLNSSTHIKKIKYNSIVTDAGLKDVNINSPKLKINLKNNHKIKSRNNLIKFDLRERNSLNNNFTDNTDIKKNYKILNIIKKLKMKMKKNI